MATEITLVTQYGDRRLTAEISNRDDDLSATIQVTTHAPVTIALDAVEARRLAGKLLDYADEVDRQNASAG